MPRPTEALTLLYSGGAGNTNPELSIGGIVSSASGRHVLSQSWTASTLPGISIVYAARNAVGAGYLSYTVSNATVTWTTFAGAVSTVGIAGSGQYTVGTITLGFLTIEVVFGSLPTGDIGQAITIASVVDTVFGAPSASELLSGVTEYRCLYLQNQSASLASDVIITLTENTPQSTVTIASSLSGSSQYATVGENWYTFKSLNWAGGRPAYTRSMGAYTSREKLIVGNQNGTPRFPFFPSAGTAVGDGVSSGVDLLLVDKYDASGLLEAVEWGSTVQWPAIPASKMVSFWLKRVLPPNPVIPTSESIDLDFTLVIS